MASFRDFLKTIVPSGTANRMRVRQTGWTARGPSVVKMWGILGALDNGEELTVVVDVTFSRSSLAALINPHISIFVRPNTFGEVDGFVILQVATVGDFLECPFATAKIDVADDGSVIISTMEKQDAESIFEALSEMKPVRILMLAGPETLFNFTLPNSANDFSNVAKAAIATWPKLSSSNAVAVVCSNA